MRITKFGHACLFIEEGNGRFLIDPGAYSQGFEALPGLDAIFITHQHGDHCDIGHLKALVKQHPSVRIYTDEQSATVLAQEGIELTTVRAGDSFEVVGVKINIIGAEHAIIHPDIPRIANVGYYIADRFFYPGDNFTNPERPVEILAAPAGAPWLKIAEAVDYVRGVGPRVAIPVHDAVLAFPQMHTGLLQRLTQSHGVEIRVVENGQSTEV